MRLRPATDADRAAWQALLGATASGDFLHDWAWADVAAFDGQPQRRFVLEEEGQRGRCRGGVIKLAPRRARLLAIPHRSVQPTDPLIVTGLCRFAAGRGAHRAERMFVDLGARQDRRPLVEELDQ